MSPYCDGWLYYSKQAKHLEKEILNRLGNKRGDVAFKLLEHARELFIYWAGQRHTSIRYFTLFFSILVVAYGYILFQGQIDCGHKQGILSGVGTVSLLITIIFFGLDRRNAELVKNAERSMDVLERALAKKLKFCAIQTTLIGDNPKCMFLQYKFIMPAFFLVFIFVSILSIVFSPCLWLSTECRISC